MSKPPPGTLPHQQADAYRIPGMRRHLLLCAGPDCVSASTGEGAWNYLKKRISELKLDQAPTDVFRTRCACLRICTGGPLFVVQPDGVCTRRQRRKSSSAFSKSTSLAAGLLGNMSSLASLSTPRWVGGADGVCPS
jgi:hypothetical protein